MKRSDLQSVLLPSDIAVTSFPDEEEENDK